MSNSEILEIHDESVQPKACTDTFESIPRINSNVSYADFFQNYLISNKPCIIENVSYDWEATCKWIKNGVIDVNYLKDTYGNTEVPVSNCNKRIYNVQDKCTMNLTDYLNYWNKHENGETNECLYLKDWHFTRDYPLDNIYKVLRYFASDWLNEYYNNNPEANDDYRFVYMGPKGSWTPFHADVFTSYSWSVNIHGRKRWLIFRPGAENSLKDELGNLKYDINLTQVPRYEVIQEKGEAIFIPSGWYHQVWNLENTISVNHNWINGCNINFVWESLQKNLLAVQHEISDCRDMENWTEQCQIVLSASFGLDYSKFYLLLFEIAKARINALSNSENLLVYGNWKIGKKHMLFDLKQVLHIMNMLIDNKDFLALKDFVKVKDSQDEPFYFFKNLKQFLFSFNS